MSQVRRIYAEKRPGYDVSAQQLCRELCEVLGTQDIERVRIFQRYDVEGVSEAALESAKGIIFSEPNVDMLYDEEIPKARKVLRAAALTYVASLLVSVMSLIRLILRPNRRK